MDNVQRKDKCPSKITFFKIQQQLCTLLPGNKTAVNRDRWGGHENNPASPSLQYSFPIPTTVAKCCFFPHLWKNNGGGRERTNGTTLPLQEEDNKNRTRYWGTAAVCVLGGCWTSTDGHHGNAGADGRKGERELQWWNQGMLKRALAQLVFERSNVKSAWLLKRRKKTSTPTQKKNRKIELLWAYFSQKKIG